MDLKTEEFDYAVKGIDAEATSERHWKRIRKYAKESFKDHVITEEQKDVFRCGKPETICYSFRVAFLPHGMIVCYGDIGDIMVQRGGEAWLRGATRDDYVSDYFFEKARPSRRSNHRGEFMPGDALKELREIHDGVPHVDAKGFNHVEQAREEGDEPTEDDWDRKPDPELALKIAEDWLTYDTCGGDGEAWGRAYYEHTSDFEYPDCCYYDSNDLWCYYALSWFVRKRTELHEVA